MSYQLRYKDFGVYQGNCMGLGFWWPMSEMPEQGFCEFPTEEDTQDYIDFLCSSECDAPLRKEDCSIEIYNKEMSERLRKHGVKYPTNN